MARWQLHSAGRQEEVACRFCSATLPDWRRVLGKSAAPQLDPLSLPDRLRSGASEGGQQQQQAGDSDESESYTVSYMRISYNGVSHKVRVFSGEGGRAQFVEDCRRLLHIPLDIDFDIVFHLREPVSGRDLSFHSLAAYDAAVAVAALSTNGVGGGSTSTVEEGSEQGEALEEGGEGEDGMGAMEVRSSSSIAPAAAALGHTAPPAGCPHDASTSRRPVSWTAGLGPRLRDWLRVWCL
ncbi:hypothetical protein FOA52_001941 [Chlamydomonas sp. UWO 241]|nr:hypothetical protein FOA52_001941 [Chlamydomonas sp. UWO 241]